MRYLIAAIIVATLLGNAASAKINVVASTQDLADIARNVGGDKVAVTALAPGDQDPHMVEPRPSMVNSLRKADVLVKIGMDLDVWVQSLVASARNKDIVYGADGYVDASVGIRKLEIPTTKLDPSMGHIHIHGNPHYWLDPANGKVIARNIMTGLARVSPSDEDYFKKRCDDYRDRIDSKIAGWKKKLAPFKGADVVTYHKSFVYFLDRFGLNDFGYVEPKPGIPPSPSHANSLIQRMKKANVKLILMEPFYPKRFPEMIARETGAKLIVEPTSVRGMKGVDSYIELFDHLTDEVVSALK